MLKSTARSASVLLFGLALGAPSTGHASVIFQNTGNTSGWSTIWQENGHCSVTQVSSPVYKGSTAVRARCRTALRIGAVTTASSGRRACPSGASTATTASLLPAQRQDHPRQHRPQPQAFLVRFQRFRLRARLGQPWPERRLPSFLVRELRRYDAAVRLPAPYVFGFCPRTSHCVPRHHRRGWRQGLPVLAH